MKEDIFNSNEISNSKVRLFLAEKATVAGEVISTALIVFSLLKKRLDVKSKIDRSEHYCA